MPTVLSLARAANARAAAAAGALGRRAGLVRPPELELRLGEFYRSAAHTVLAMAHAAPLQIDPASLYRLRSLLSAADYRRVALHTRPGAATPALVTDDPSGAAPGRQVVRIDGDYYAPDAPPGTVVSPYFLHPHLYATGLYRRLPRLRRAARAARVFFAGSAARAGYDAPLGFDMMKRHEVIAALREDFPRETAAVTTRPELGRALRAGRPVVLVLTDRTEDTLAKHALTPREYLGLVADSAFALCPPGARMPHAHNLVEALALGTVPVLPYGHLCEPLLADGVDSLAYGDRPSLRAAVERALATPAEEAARMGRAAARAYDTAMSPEAFGLRLREALAAGGDVVLRVNDEIGTAAKQAVRAGG